MDSLRYSTRIKKEIKKVIRESLVALMVKKVSGLYIILDNVSKDEVLYLFRKKT